MHGQVKSLRDNCIVSMESIFEKIFLDRRSMTAAGSAKRPSAIVDALGFDEAAERLISVMQDAADKMYQVAWVPGQRMGMQYDTIVEAHFRDIASERGIAFMQIEDLAMPSLLQPAGRDMATRQRLLRFAHRSFQDWFLARQYAEQGRDGKGLPDTAARFLDSMRADLAAGGSLPDPCRAMR